MKTFEEMESEDGYTMLNFKNHLKSRQKSTDFSWYLQYCGLTLAFGCIGVLVFMMTMTGLKFQDKNTDFPQKVNTSSLTGNNYKCSSDWLLNQGKCYWFSTSFKTWKESQHDCEKLQAHLLVIHDLKELVFIQSTIKPGHFGWIGLHITSEGNLWTWIDEHFLDPHLFLVIGPTDDKSCAIMTGSQVYSEDCNSRFNGICQKDAV